MKYLLFVITSLGFLRTRARVVVGKQQAILQPQKGTCASNDMWWWRSSKGKNHAARLLTD